MLTCPVHGYWLFPLGPILHAPTARCQLLLESQSVVWGVASHAVTRCVAESVVVDTQYRVRKSRYVVILHPDCVGGNLSSAHSVLIWGPEGGGKFLTAPCWPLLEPPPD